MLRHFLRVEREEDVARLAAVLHTLLPLLKSSEGALYYVCIVRWRWSNYK
jgi:hypothetical protein